MIVSTREINGYLVKIYQDDCPQNPRTEWDNLGTMICCHFRYKMGDKHDFSNPEEVIAFLKKEKPIFLPIYMYDHSEVSVSTKNTYPYNNVWDSGQVGVIFATKETIKKEFNCKIITKKIQEEVLNLLESEVEVYNQYLTGDVYGYEIDNPEGGYIDSCWGFYGWENIEKYMIPICVLPAIDSDMKKRQEEKAKAITEEVQEISI